MVWRCGCGPGCVGGVGRRLRPPHCAHPLRSVVHVGCHRLCTGWVCVGVGTSCRVLVRPRLVVLFERLLVEG